MGRWSRRGSAHDVVVAVGAEEDADCGCVSVMGAQVVVDPGDVEVEFADVFRLEAPDFQLDDDEARLGPVEEEEIDVEVVAADFEVVLTAREGESVAELEQEAFRRFINAASSSRSAMRPVRLRKSKT